MIAVHLWTGGAGVAGWRPNVFGLVAASAAFALAWASRREAAR
jgi:hypothetical protein